MKIKNLKIEKRLNLIIGKIIGINKAISISKIKNISLIKKNWILKGIRVLEIGSNPHSKDEFFSRLFFFFFDKMIFKINIITEIKKKIIDIKIILIIIYIKFN